MEQNHKESRREGSERLLHHYQPNQEDEQNGGDGAGFFEHAENEDDFAALGKSIIALFRKGNYHFYQDQCAGFLRPQKNDHRG